MTTFLELITPQSLSTILARGLQIASGLGLPVTSWRPGDPTRSLYHFLAEALQTRESYTVEFIRAALLSTARGDWLTVVASEVYGVDRTEATYATSTVTLTNAGGGYYAPEPGDVVVKSTLSGKTYRSTTGGTLAGGTTLQVQVIADEAGSDSNAAEDEIDALVTQFLGVTVTASTVAIAQDEQEDEPLREQCRATLGALSPNGPPDAYEYVARNPDLTGTTIVTKAKSVPNSSTGQVKVYIAGAAGAVTGAEETAVQNAIEAWATPLCITPDAQSASNVSVNVTATVTGDDIPAGYEADAEAAVTSAIAALNINAPVARSMIISVLQRLAEDQGADNVSVTLAAPAADVPVDVDEVATVGTVSITVVT